MVIYPGPTSYQQVDATRLKRIVHEHLAEGKPVAEYFWTGIRRRILPDGRRVHVGKPVSESKIDPPVPSRERNLRRTKAQPEVDDFKW
jgi:(2Fe-2S) ferredoxin